MTFISRLTLSTVLVTVLSCTTGSAQTMINSMGPDPASGGGPVSGKGLGYSGSMPNDSTKERSTTTHTAGDAPQPASQDRSRDPRAIQPLPPDKGLGNSDVTDHRQ